MLIARAIAIGLFRRKKSLAQLIADLFSQGQQGAWYDPSDMDTAKLTFRRNLLTKTEQFDDVVWAALSLGVTVTPNTTIAPDGLTTADTLACVASSYRYLQFASGASLLGKTYTFSVWVWSTTGKGAIGVRLAASNDGADAAFISVTLTTTPTRISVTRTFTTTGTNIDLGFDNRAGQGGDGTASSFVAWGAQLDLGTVTPYQKITDYTTEFLAAFPTHTLYQDSAGATPVTAVEQPVGRMLDKSGRGNHASQSTAASRPVLSARVNLMTKTEQFDDAVWTKQGTGVSVAANTVLDPLGGLTADTLTGANGLTWGGNVLAGNIGGLLSSTLYAWSIWYKFGTTTTASFILRDQTTGVETEAVLSASAEWQRVSLSRTTSSTTTVLGLIIAKANGTLHIWGAQFEPGTTATRYQRVNTASDYDSIGFPMYLRFDGVDDSLATAAVNFTSTSQLTYFTGVRRLSQSATQTMFGLGEGSIPANGSLLLYSSTSGSLIHRLRGTLALAEVATSGRTAPESLVVTGQFDLAQATAAAKFVSGRINQVAGLFTGAPGDTGAGPFVNGVITIGARQNNTGIDLPFNGNFYGLIIRGTASSASEIAAAERYVASKTGVVIS